MGRGHAARRACCGSRDVARGKERPAQLDKLADDGTTAKLEASGKRLASTSWDTTARVWDTSTGKLLHVLEGHKGPVNAALASRWLNVQPECAGVIRGPDGVVGYALHVIVPSGSTLDSEDPVVRAVLQHADLRPGEQVLQGAAGLVLREPLLGDPD